MSAKSQFTPTKGPEQNGGYGFNVGGAVIKQKSNFSLAVNGQSQYITPNLTVATPDGDALRRARTAAAVRERQHQRPVRLRADPRSDAAVRLFTEQQLGGATRASAPTTCRSGRSRRTTTAYTFRALEAGPIGRRVFINSRMTMTWRDFGNTSAVEAPTIIVQDAFTSGGAQQSGRVHGRNMTLASDVDYIRGLHSWRGRRPALCRLVSRQSEQQLSGHVHLQQPRAAFEAGTPLLYTRSVGDPRLDFFHARLGAYVQDDIRVGRD